MLQWYVACHTKLYSFNNINIILCVSFLYNLNTQTTAKYKYYFYFHSIPLVDDQLFVFFIIIFFFAVKSITNTWKVLNILIIHSWLQREIPSTKDFYFLNKKSDKCHKFLTKLIVCMCLISLRICKVLLELYVFPPQEQVSRTQSKKIHNLFGLTITRDWK